MTIDLDFSTTVPDLAALGEDLLVPFTARRLKAPRLLWLNKRWFAENGVDAFDPAVAQALEGQLLDKYAFCVPKETDHPDAFDVEERVFKADRYAGEGVTFNGGSGRVGLRGSFQVKGIGRTPLSSDETDYFHAHGGASLEECIRETIYSEVVSQEFPHGGVPIVALILTGTFTDWHTEQGIVYERRALILRPAFVRPAIFERALYFRKDRFFHLPDVARVKQAVQWYLREGCDTYGPLTTLGERIARQIAFGVVNRLTHGAYSTSNMTLSGGLADYGVTAALPDWAHYVCVKNLPGTGKEIEFVLKVSGNISYYIGKYGGAEGIEKAKLRELPQAIVKGYQEGIERELLQMCGIPSEMEGADVVNILLAQLRGYFQAQQREVADIFIETPEPRSGWLYSALFEPTETDLESPLSWRVAEIRESLAGIYARLYPDAPEHGWVTLSRYLQPRAGLFRQELKGRIDKNLVNGGLSEEVLPAAVSQLIRDTVVDNRRHWPRLPAGYIVLGQTGGEDGDALYCEAQGSQQHFLVLEGIRCGTAFRCFGAKIPLNDLAQQRSVRYVPEDGILIVPAPAAAWAAPISVVVAGHTLHVPTLRRAYIRTLAPRGERPQSAAPIPCSA